MTKGNISIWKVEVFLVNNFKQIPTENGDFKLEAKCSMKELFERLEEIIEK